MHINRKAFRTIWFDEKDQAVKIIDQTKLPHKFEVKNLKTVKDAINAIKTMEVRGAPLIGATAAYGVVLAIMEKNDSEFIKKSCEDLIKSRPTAINLKWAVNRIMKKLYGVNNNEILKIALEEAKLICEEDVKFCENIGLNISKQSVNPGKNFGPYGLPKSALLSLCKQYAVDYGSYGIRSNGVNADRIRSGLMNDKMIRTRAKARSISTDDYMRGNLLLNEVKAEDVAKAFFHLATSKKTTGAVLTVDGGNIAASLR